MEWNGRGMVWRGMVEYGLAWHGGVWPGRGMVWHDMARLGYVMA